MGWLIITIKSNQSKRAEYNLVNQGIKTFFPKITYRLNNKVITKDLFPGYAFIKLPQLATLASINSTRGVSRLMCINELIPELSDSVIKKIKKQLEDLNFSFSTQEPFKKNDKVVIKLKIFNNQEAEVVEILDKKNTKRVLLKILSSSKTIWLRGNDLDSILSLAN